MKKYCGGADFKTLYYNFTTRDISGKLFTMEEYETESLQIGAGVTIFIGKAESFLLNILKDWYDEKPHALIGDIPMFFNTVFEREKNFIKDKIQRGKERFERIPKVSLQLHNILREHQGLNKTGMNELKENIA
ncbi:MAG: hypothetical protein JXQ93_03295 [Flavobacteriaceae bacterium]